MSGTAERVGVVAGEFGEGARRPAGEIRDDVRYGHCFPARSLVSADGEGAFDDGRRITLSDSTRAGLFW